jgi:hypothetical protein
MSEEKQENTRPGNANQIFRYIGLTILAGVRIANRSLKWIGLILLATLIALGLLTQAPWKVMALLLIILAACTILPKPLRKWFWLSVCLVITALFIWLFLPDDNDGWRPYTFDAEVAALEAKRAVPPEENAATIYNQLLDNYDASSLYPDFLTSWLDNLTTSRPWSSKQYPQAAIWLEGHENTIATLMQVCEKDTCRFPIAGNLDDPERKAPANFKAVTAFWWSLQHARLLPMTSWAGLLVRSANNDIADGRTDLAIEKYVAILQMAKHLFQQPTTLDMVAGFAMERRAIEQIIRFLVTGDADDKHLILLEETLQNIRHDWSSEFQKVIEREKLRFKNLVCAMFYQTNAEGKIRLNRDPNSTLRSQSRICPMFSGGLKETYLPRHHNTYWRRKFTKAETIFCWFFMPSTPQKAAKVIDGIYEKFLTTQDPDFDLTNETEGLSEDSFKFNFTSMMELLVYISEPSYFKIHDIYSRTATFKRANRLIIALRRYKNENGRWPEKLQDIEHLAPAEVLIDPVNNSSFVYKLTENNFILYSKGKNNIDENGRYYYKWWKRKAEPDDWLIWYERRRRRRSRKQI